MAISEGKKAPAFNLPASQSSEPGDETKISLKDFEGKFLVLYFYPKDSTPGCTVEAQDFRDALKKFKKMNAEIVGVSKDGAESHCKFIGKHDLNFPLLSDEKGTMLEKYGAWGEKNMYGNKFMGIIRTTVVIGPDSKVIKIFPNVKVKGHVDKVLQCVKDAQS